MKLSRTKPPRWATKLLHWYCAPHLLEEIEGDLEEEFYFQAKHKGYSHAARDYIRSVLGFIKPFALKRKSTPTPTSFTMKMFYHYLTVAMRNIIRHKAFSAINIIGLAFGLTCCMAIFLWVREELAVDNFHKENENLYTVYMTVKSKAGAAQGSYNSPRSYYKNQTHMLLADVKQSIPEVKAVSFYATGYTLPWGHPETFQVGTKIYKLEGSRASEEFFTMFNYPVIAGNAKAALKDLSSIAISRKMANLFFGSPADAIGKSMHFENSFDLQVAAVFEDLTEKSSMKFEYLINWESQMTRLNWSSHIMITNLLLADNANVKDVTAKLNKLVKPRLDKNQPYAVELGLQPFRDQYLMANFRDGKPAGGRIEYIELFSGVAVFILIIACINFMNLATARSVKRAKEVGVRKVIGSSRSYLIVQFFCESIVLAGFALTLSLLLLQLMLPMFNNFTGRHMTSPLFDSSTWLMLGGLTLVTGLFAGSYPALFLSSLKPARVLKGVVQFTKSAIWLRRSLAIFQFGLSIMLLIAAIVVSRQTSYMQNVNLGYDKENLVYFSIEGELGKYDKYAAFKEQALKMPGVKVVDRSSEAPHAMGFIVDEEDGMAETPDPEDSAIKWEGKEKGASVGFKPTSVGFDFVKLMDLHIAEGRNFSRDHATDSADAFLINEQAVKEMHMKDPIGKWISAWQKKGHIVGVLKDYNSNSLHERIKPLIVDVKEYEYFGVVLVRIEAGKTKETLTALEKIYKAINPNYPFDFRFVDEENNKMYHSEQMMSSLSGFFSALAVIISCLGLLGLVMFSAEQRVKEIGIRKVLGATVTSIVTLLSKDFLRLIAIAFAIGAPVAGYFMHQWLQSFAFQIDLSWWIYAIAGSSVLFVALLTISIQAFQSAIANPAKSLKAE